MDHLHDQARHHLITVSFAFFEIVLDRGHLIRHMGKADDELPSGSAKAQSAAASISTVEFTGLDAVVVFLTIPNLFHSPAGDIFIRPYVRGRLGPIPF